MTKILIEATIIDRSWIPTEEGIRKRVAETLANCYGARQVYMQSLVITENYGFEFEKDSKNLKMVLKK